MTRAGNPFSGIKKLPEEWLLAAGFGNVCLKWLALGSLGDDPVVAKHYGHIDCAGRVVAVKDPG